MQFITAVLNSSTRLGSNYTKAPSNSPYCPITSKHCYACSGLRCPCSLPWCPSKFKIVIRALVQGSCWLCSKGVLLPLSSVWRKMIWGQQCGVCHMHCLLRCKLNKYKTGNLYKTQAVTTYTSSPIHKSQCYEASYLQTCPSSMIQLRFSQHNDSKILGNLNFCDLMTSDNIKEWFHEG